MILILLQNYSFLQEIFEIFWCEDCGAARAVKGSILLSQFEALKSQNFLVELCVFPKFFVF